LPEWHLWHENACLNGICGMKMLAYMAFAAQKCLPEWHLQHKNARQNGIFNTKMLA
jgi:hypothetical protein